MPIRFCRISVVLVMVVGLGGLLGASDSRMAAPGPMLRQTNYLALLPAEDASREIVLWAEQYSPVYSDLLEFTLIGPDSSVLATGEVALGANVKLTIPPTPEGLHAVELNSGWNACRIDPRTTVAAFVAREALPLHTARAVPRLFFYVPGGLGRFSIWLAAETPREGARIQICGPDRQIVVEEEGDYDQPHAIRVAVPPGAAGAVWSLALLAPRTPGLYLDDVRLWLDSGLPPYLTTRDDWALLFGKRHSR